MTTSLATPPKLQFFDLNGAPLSGGKLYTYVAGTTTPQASYTDYGGGTANANPVILDSRGEASVWLGTALYKMALYDSTNVLIWTVDNLNGGDVATLAQLAASGGSNLIGFLQAGTGAVATTVQSKLRESITPEDFGAVGDGVTNDTTAIHNALVAANGKAVVFQAGKIYRITQPLTNASVSQIRAVGQAPANFSHQDILTLINTYSNSYSNLLSTTPLAGVAAIKCDGCNLIGAPDTGTMNGDATKLRTLQNIFVYGVNGAKTGVYICGSDVTISGCTFALFEQFGLLMRGQITSAFTDNAFIDCGWNLGASGSVGYPNTYYSGCGILILANKTSNDYTTVGADRASTLEFINNFVWVRNDTITTKSGFRGVQSQGVLSADFSEFGSYTGSLFTLNTGLNFDGYHLENYSTAGFAIGDGTPYAFYGYNTQGLIGGGYAAHMNNTNLGNEIFLNGSGTANIQQTSTQLNRGYPITNGKSITDLKKTISVVTPGGTDIYTFSNLLSNSDAFMGIIMATCVRLANYTSYSRGAWITGTHRAGGSGWQPMTAVQITQNTSIAGLFQAVLTPSFSNGDLQISIQWGASWVVGTQFQIDVGLFGTLPLSI
jgi:hypothetical protein